MRCRSNHVVFEYSHMYFNAPLGHKLDSVLTKDTSWENEGEKYYEVIYYISPMCYKYDKSIISSYIIKIKLIGSWAPPEKLMN